MLQRGGSCYGLLDITNAKRNQANTGGPIPTGQIPTGQIPTGQIPTGQNQRGRLPADVIAKAQKALIPINENTTVADIILAPMTGYYEVTKQRTMGNGDCMYSSIYRAAKGKFQCVIDEVLKHDSDDPPNLVAMAGLEAQSEEEMRFVQNARSIVALYGVNTFKNLYNQMLHNYKYDIKEFDGIINGGTLDYKIKNIIYDHIVNKPNKDAFVKAYIENTLNLDANGNIPNARAYSGQIEYEIIEQFIKERCNIDIGLPMSESNTVRIQVKPNTLYIENQGGGHYEYFKIGDAIAPFKPNDDEIITRLRKLFNPQVSSDMMRFLLKEKDKAEAIRKILRISETVPKGKTSLKPENYGTEYLTLKALTEAWVKGGRQRKQRGGRKSASKSEMGCGCGLKLSGGRRKTRRSKKARKTRKARK